MAPLVCTSTKPTGRSPPEFEVRLVPSDFASHHLWAFVNGEPVNFILDTGADIVCLSKEDADNLKQKQALNTDDHVGFETMGDANGGKSLKELVNLRSMRAGNSYMENVPTIIGCRASLLGQTFLRRFQWYRIDNARNVLVLGAQKVAAE